MAESDEPRQHPTPAVPSAETVDARLAEAALSDSVRKILKDALGEGERREGPTAGRIHLDSVAVTGFRGIGCRTWLKLGARPGVTLVVGRNGSGKSSIAEAVEVAFTGEDPRRRTANATRSGNWRNLHDGDRPEIEVRLSIAGDPGPSTLTRKWTGAAFGDSEAELRRPGHGRIPFRQAGWQQALTDHRPFLSHADLDRLINGKPSEMYDNIAPILGLGRIFDADQLLGPEERELDRAAKTVKEETAGLKEALYELEDDERAVQALVAIDTKGRADLETLDALVAGLPTVDEGRIAELRAAAGHQGPDVDRIRDAVDRLRHALADVEDVQATGADDARRLADLLDAALEHGERHPDDESCPVCGGERRLDEEWAARATAEVAVLRRTAKDADDAHAGLRQAVRTVQDLVVRAPGSIPEALAGPWNVWAACRTIDDPRELAGCAEAAAVTLADACAAVRKEAAEELERRDERWRGLAVRLGGWAERARAAEREEPRLRDLRKARAWLKALSAELRAQRMAGFADHSQRIWEKLRDKSNVDLKAVSLHGSEKATVRKLVMDVSVDGTEAPALGVMSTGEQHSLALALFLPRSATADSPFGFIVVDDPVQSMDPAKVHGLAQVLHELGEHRQVVVFTHDTRLQHAFTSQNLQVTVFQVDREESSRVRVEPVADPVGQAIDDARAIAATQDLPAAARTHVLPGLCRIALENAFLEAAWIRHHRSGGSERELHQAVADADKLMKVAALALFGDIGRTGEVYRKLTALCGPRAVGLVKQCQGGAHAGGAQIADPYRFVDEIESIAQKVRKPEVAA